MPRSSIQAADKPPARQLPRQATSPVPASGPTLPSAASTRAPAKLPQGLGQDHLQLSARATRPGPTAAAPVTETPPSPADAVKLALAGKSATLPASTVGLSDHVPGFDLTIKPAGKNLWDITAMDHTVRLHGAIDDPAATAQAIGEYLVMTCKDDIPLKDVAFMPSPAGTLVVPVGADGKAPDVTLTSDDSTPGTPRYTVTMGANSVNVSMPADSEQAVVLSHLINLLSVCPEHVRGYLKQVRINTQESPNNAYWSQVYHMKMSAGATAGNGAIDFWGGYHSVDAKTLRHEFGHVISEHYATRGKNNDYPDGYVEAIAQDQQAAQAQGKTDGSYVSGYAKESPAEDFAETWAAYVKLRALDAATGDTHLETDFKAAYPNRVPFLQGIYDGTLKPFN